MAQRILPGAYVSLNDMSNLPEGQLGLTVGYVLQANRGPVNQVNLVTDSTDFLTQYTFSGKPTVTSDPTFWSILNVLRNTNAVYVSRAAKNPLYGGATFTSREEITDLVGVSAPLNPDNDILGRRELRFNEAKLFKNGEMLEISGSYIDADSVRRIVAFSCEAIVDEGAAASTTLLVSTKGDKNPNAITDVTNIRCWKSPVQPLENREIGEFTMDFQGDNLNRKEFIFEGDIASSFSLGLKFKVVAADGSTAPSATEYQVVDNEDADPIRVEGEGVSAVTIVKVTEVILADTSDGTVTGKAYFYGLGKPSNLNMAANELLLVTGKDPGQYNNDIGIRITSSVDDTNMVYRRGNMVGGVEIDFDTIQLDVFNTNISNTEPIESFVFSRDPKAKTIDGLSLYVDNVVAGSAYITVVNNTNAEDKDDTYKKVPASTFGDPTTLAGGSNGEEIDETTLEAALEGFKDKSVTVSILGNGCSALSETKQFQQALMGVADLRKDLVVFLNNPYEGTERNVTLPSQRAKNIVDYKKGELRSTSFYGCMYAPHVNTTDIFNGGSKKIGAESVAISGWLNVISNLNYPYAYAGPRNGLVQGVTCDWKIGDESNEAALMNDASINYVAFDSRVGRYYMQCQNTLQVANSSMRNIGTVLNVLDIKENFTILLKEYLQLPITDNLRREIVDISNDYLSPMLGVRFSNYTFQDVTSTYDLANNTLRYLLTIAPTPYAQRIYLTMNIVNATFDFSITQSM